MDLKSKLKEMLAGKNRRKLIENAAIVLGAGIVILILSNGMFGSKSGSAKTPSPSASPSSVPSAGSAESEALNLEARLETILKEIKGVGDVSVLVTYETVDEVRYVYDSKNGNTVTEETDSAGGKRSQQETNSENSVAYSEDGSSKEPIVAARVMPAVKGVVVVCDGGNDINVRNSVSRAVQALTGVAAHKIEVLPGR